METNSLTVWFRCLDSTDNSTFRVQTTFHTLRLHFLGLMRQLALNACFFYIFPTVFLSIPAMSNNQSNFERMLSDFSHKRISTAWNLIIILTGFLWLYCKKRKLVPLNKAHLASDRKSGYIFIDSRPKNQTYQKKSKWKKAILQISEILKVLLNKQKIGRKNNINNRNE